MVSLGTMPKMFKKKNSMLMKEKGWQYIMTQTSIAPADVTTQVLQMKNFGCDYVYLYNSETAIIVWIRELERQNYHPMLAGTSALASDEMWRAVGKSVVGAVMPQFSVQWTEQGTLAPVTDWLRFPPLSAEQQTDAWWLQ